MGSKSKKRQAKRAEQRAHQAAPASKPGAANAANAKPSDASGKPKTAELKPKLSKSLDGQSAAPPAVDGQNTVQPEEVVASLVASIVPALFDENADGRASDTASTVSSHPDSSPPHSEHRAHRRVSMQIEIGLGSETHFFSGLSGDVSEGGVFVQTYQELPVGSEVELELKLPSGDLTTHGTVRWHRSKSDSAPPGVGVAFEALTDDARSVIHDFCEARAPLYYDVDHG